MALQNAVVALLVQGASHSVQVADSGSRKRAPDHHAYSSMFDSWCHTEEPSFRRLDGVQKRCVMNRRFQILIHRSIRPSSSFQYSTGGASWPRQASCSYFAILVMAFLLPLDLSNLELEVFSSQLKLRLPYFDQC